MIFELIPIKVIVDIYYGVLLEERILLISEKVDILTVAIEAIFELLFPFSPINYRVISKIPADMHFFLGLP